MRALRDDPSETPERAPRADGPGETSFTTDTEGEFHLTVDVRLAYRHPATEHHPDPERIPGVAEISITVVAQQPL